MNSILLLFVQINPVLCGEFFNRFTDDISLAVFAKLEFQFLDRLRHRWRQRSQLADAHRFISHNDVYNGNAYITQYNCA